MIRIVRHHTGLRKCGRRDENHVAVSAEEVNCTRDQSLLATICRKLRKGGIPVPNGRRPPIIDPSNTLSTSPPISVRTIGVYGARRISLADVTLHLTRDETHVLKELNRQFLVTKNKREKHTVRCHHFSVVTHARRKISAPSASSANDRRTESL